MTADDRWNVRNDRRAGLTTANIQVRAAREDAIVYYPGSGDDILHALFATWSRGRYYVFVDFLDLSKSIFTAIKEQGKSRLNTVESSNILRNLNIRSRADDAWMFGFEGAQRFLFWFKTGHDTFLNANPQFRCRVLFEKDFWETSAEVDLSIIDKIEANGFYITNASIGGLQHVLKLLGLRHAATVQINGDQYVYQKSLHQIASWTTLKPIVAACKRTAGLSALDDDGMPADNDAAVGTIAAAALTIRAQFNPFHMTVADEKAAARELLEFGLGNAADYYRDQIAAACA
jgi:hypothetical protein